MVIHHDRWLKAFSSEVDSTSARKMLMRMIRHVALGCAISCFICNLSHRGLRSRGRSARAAHGVPGPLPKGLR